MTAFERLESILLKLDALRVQYDIKHVREGAILIGIATPGKRWEVEIFSDGKLEVEIFLSQGVVTTTDLNNLFQELK